MSAPIRIRTRVINDDVIGTLTMDTADGPLVLRTRVPMRAVRRYLQARQGTKIGWGFFKKIAKRSRKLAKKLARSKLVKSALKVANHPAVASFLPGPVTTAVRYLEAGRKLVAASKKGNPKARAAIDLVRAQARYKRDPSASNWASANVLQKRASALWGRRLGNPRFSSAIRACA